MIITNSKGSRYHPYITIGNSRKRVYYDIYIRRMPGGWLQNTKKKKKFGNRECERRMRQMAKISLRKAA